MNPAGKRFLIGFVMVTAVVIFFGLQKFIHAPPIAAAAPVLQLTEFPTPTPGPDGRILYVVQDGDTLWRIAAVSGISIDELRGLNNLSADAIILPGQTLLLGFGGPSEPPTLEPGANPTPLETDLTPTPTSGPGFGMVCVLLYDDINGDALRQEAEVAIPDGAISLSDRLGSVSLTADTEAGLEPVCFEELIEGDYNISIAIPDGYNPTTVLNLGLELQAGDEAYIDFGAQISTSGLDASPPPEEGGRSPILGIVGGLLLLGGVGLAIYATRMGGRLR